jgi:hypothetical protein
MSEISKSRVEKLLCEAGHHINRVNGRDGPIEDFLCKITSLCTDLLGKLDHDSAPPLWVGDAANRILSSWPEWDAEAEMTATVEQDSNAGEAVMLAKLEAAITEEWRKV